MKAVAKLKADASAISMTNFKNQVGNLPTSTLLCSCVENHRLKHVSLGKTGMFVAYFLHHSFGVTDGSIGSWLADSESF